MSGSPWHTYGDAIVAEMHGSGSLLGYRALWNRLRCLYRLPVARDTVMRLLPLISPEDSRARTRRRLRRRQYYVKGPNMLWHIDGNDKLKQYGFAIHACIDGYSRRIIWIDVGVSNNDPKIIAHYYLESINKLGGTPMVVRSDLGTENCVVAVIQPFLRRNNQDDLTGERSFCYGRSVSNQRIEAWWGQLRRWSLDWWMQLFEGLKHRGLFDETNFIDVYCLRFAFIQKELYSVCAEWNRHKIRPNHANEISGIPDELYFMPQLAGRRDCKCDVDVQDIQYLERYTSSPRPPAPLEFIQLADVIMTENGFTMPDNAMDALELYIELLVTIKDLVMS